MDIINNVGGKISLAPTSFYLNNFIFLLNISVIDERAITPKYTVVEELSPVFAAVFIELALPLVFAAVFAPLSDSGFF